MRKRFGALAWSLVVLALCAGSARVEDLVPLDRALRGAPADLTGCPDWAPRASL